MSGFARSANYKPISFRNGRAGAGVASRSSPAPMNFSAAPGSLFACTLTCLILSLMLSRNLLSLLLSLMLALSPFASLDAVAATAGEGHCMKMDMGDAASGHSMPGCKHCSDDGCGDTSCADHGCSASHILSLLLTSRVHTGHNQTSHYVAGAGIHLLSYSSPPLLRPPV